MIEVADSGMGFSPTELDYYRWLACPDDAQRPTVPATCRSGTGIRQTAAWLGDYKDSLQLMATSESLGGACVRIWLPTIDAPIADGNP